MKIFTKMYEQCIRWGQHKFAIYYLSGLSFLESIIFPIPVDVILAPMVLADRSKAMKLAAITTFFSVLGGIVGFALGWFLLDSVIYPLVIEYGFQASFDRASIWFKEYGVWVVFIAGFSPIPYKVFTLTAGGLHMAFLPFVIASIVGRAGRFFLVATIIYYGGPTIESKLKRYVDQIGWTVVSAVIVFILYKQLT
jgi:membrane protein YqaA with SNARE-associated domain